MKTKNALPLIIQFTLTAAQSGFASLIRNGSFEESVEPGSIGFNVVIAGSKDIASWEVTGDSVDLKGVLACI